MPEKDKAELMAFVDELMNDPDDEFFDSAAQEAVRELVEELTDEDPDVRMESLETLGSRGVLAISAVPRILPLCTDDDDADVREAAVWSLNSIAKTTGGLGPITETVAPILIDALNDESEGMKGAAAATLGHLVLQDSGKAVAALEGLIEDENLSPSLKAVVTEAVGRLDDS